jgi:hypothetical protein
MTNSEEWRSPRRPDLVSLDSGGAPGRPARSRYKIGEVMGPRQGFCLHL